MKSITLLVALFLATTAYSQVNVDSLRQVWNDPTQDDSARFTAIVPLLNEFYMKQDPDSALVVLDLAIEEATRKHRRDMLATFYYDKGRTLRMTGKMVDAKHTLRIAQATFQNLDDTMGIADCHNEIAQVAWITGSLDSAAVELQKAKELYRAIRFQLGVVGSTVNLGILERMRGNYREAERMLKMGVSMGLMFDDASLVTASNAQLSLVYLEQGNLALALKYQIFALEKEQETNNQIGIAYAKMDLGGIYSDIGEYEIAKKHLQDALEIMVELKNDHGRAMMSNSLGAIANDLGEASEAMRFYQEALGVFQDVGDLESVGMVIDNIANIHNERHEYEVADSLYREALRIQQNLGSGRLLNTTIDFAVNILDMGRADEAIASAEKAMMMANSEKADDYEKRAAQILWRAYKTKGNITKALAMHERYSELNDSIFNDAKRKEMLTATFDFEYRQKLFADSIAEVRVQEEELRLANLEASAHNRRNRVQYSGIIILVILLALLIGFSKKVRLGNRTAEAIIFVFFILIFEFVLVVLDPYIAQWSDDEVGFKLAINSIFALLIFFAHHYLEGKIKKRLLIKPS